MSKSKGYKIDWNRNTVIMTRRFAERASDIANKEYKQLMDFRANGFSVVEKWYRPRRACPTRVTYKMMTNYFSTLPTKTEEMKKFRAVREESKSYHNPYEYVRQWFIREYPGYIDALVKNSKRTDSEVNLQIVPDGQDPEKKSA